MAGGFQSTEKPTLPRAVTPATKMLVDASSGAPVGIQNPNANGEDFLPLPAHVSQAQIDNPTQAMIDDIDATYMLTDAPHNRWRSNGSVLIGLDAEDFTYVQYGQIFYDPLTVTSPDILVVSGNGELRVRPWP